MEASKDACPICLEGLSKEVSSVDPCNHTFWLLFCIKSISNLAIALIVSQNGLNKMRTVLFA